MSEKNSSKIPWRTVLIVGLIVGAIELFVFPTLCSLLLPGFTNYPADLPNNGFMRWDVVFTNIWGLQLFFGLHLFILFWVMAGDSSKKSKLGMGPDGKPLSSGTTEYGSARLLSDDEFKKKYKSYVQKENSIVSDKKEPGGVVVKSVKLKDWSGHKDSKGRKDNVASEVKVFYEDGQVHHCVIGSTGAGKTTNWVEPSVFSLMHAKASMCIADPKGELYLRQHKVLEENGYTVFVLNFTNPAAGQNFNQLDYINKQYEEGMPYLYQSKAIRELIKYASYMKSSTKEEAPVLKGYDTRKLDIDLAAGRRAPEWVFDFGDFEYISEPNYKNVLNTENGEIIVKYLREIFVRSYEIAYKTFKKPTPADMTESNIYLHYKQENVLVAGIEFLKQVNKENIIDYFKKRIMYYEDFMHSVDPSTSLYFNANNKVKEFKKYLEEIEGQSGYSTDVLLKYMKEFESECFAIFSKHEQEAVTNAQTIASMIVESKQVGARGESIWIDTPKALLASLILFVARESHMMHSQHLGSVYRMLSELSVPVNAKSDKTCLDTIVDAFLPSDAIKLTQTATRIAGDRTKTSILVSTITPMQLWADERVISQCARTSFDIRTVVDKPTAIFLNIPGPDTQPTYTILASLFIEQLYASLVQITNTYTDLTLPRPFYFILDEFGNLPKIPNFGSKISLARSRNIKINYIVQSLQQLDMKYKDDKNLILGNSNILYLLTNEIDTAKYISERLGKYTAEIESNSSSESKDKGSSSSSSVSKFGRELFTPQELMDNFPKYKGIYIAPRQPAAFVDLWPSYWYPTVDHINAIRVDDLQVERPTEEINFFSPADYEQYIVAYKLFWNDAILDKFFKKMIEPRAKKK